VHDLAVAQVHDDVARAVPLAAQHADGPFGERPPGEPDRADPDALQRPLLVEPGRGTERAHRREERHDLVRRQRRRRGERRHPGDPGERVLPVGDRVEHLRQVTGGHVVLDGYAQLAVQLVGQVVLADVVGVAVGGQHHEPTPLADPEGGGLQRLAEAGGHPRVDQHEGVAAAVQEGVGDIRLVVLEVELLAQHQRRLVIDLDHIAERRHTVQRNALGDRLSRCDSISNWWFRRLMLVTMSNRGACVGDPPAG
jgi:hypothetical protein